MKSNLNGTGASRCTSNLRPCLSGLLLASALFAGTLPARASLCGDTVDIRFAQFPNSVTTAVTCPGVELPCAGPALGLPGSCRFSIDVESNSVRIFDFGIADYGTGATITVRDLDPLVCDGTVLGTVSGVDVSHVNSAGFVPEATFTANSVTVSLAKGTTRWKPGDSIQLFLEYEGDCPSGDGTTRRSGWVPNVGRLLDSELPLGDLYTLQCPAEGSLDLFVDTKDDLDTAQSCLDPVVEIYDSSGNVLAVGDDEAECTYPPVCGYSCPAVQNLSCGGGGELSLVVRDYGTASTTGTSCNKGGGYELQITVFDSSGQPVDTNQVAVGGGPAGDPPAWLAPLGLPQRGPVLDDENVPSAATLEGLANASPEMDARRLRQAIRRLIKKEGSTP